MMNNYSLLLLSFQHRALILNSIIIIIIYYYYYSLYTIVSSPTSLHDPISEQPETTDGK